MSPDTPRTRYLASGFELPKLGLGLWQVPDGPECTRAVRWALESGYRLIDTAQAYRNETSVGRAIRESGIARDEIFLTTKFHPGGRDPRGAAEDSLRRLDTDYLDLYLVHWPEGGATRAWPGMEAAVTGGLVRSIGVSNYSRSEVDSVLQGAHVVPAVNQIQLSPYEYRSALIDTCESAGIVAQAYSPLGTGRHLATPAVRGIATRLGRTPAQVLIRWCIQKNLSVIAKSTHQARIAENAEVFDFELDGEDIDVLDSQDTTGHTDLAMAAQHKWWI